MSQHALGVSSLFLAEQLCIVWLQGPQRRIAALVQLSAVLRPSPSSARAFCSSCLDCPLSPTSPNPHSYPFPHSSGTASPDTDLTMSLAWLNILLHVPDLILVLHDEFSFLTWQTLLSSPVLQLMPPHSLP